MGSEETQVDKTPVEQLLDFHLAFCHSAYRLCESKNHDYAGAGGLQPYRNFEAVEALGIAPTEVGLLIRITDKVQRLTTWVHDGKLVVENESAVDSLLDIVNYTVILAAYMRQRHLRCDDHE